MAKENKKNATRTSIDELNESLSSFEQRVEQNKKKVVWYIGGLIAIIAIGLGYYYGIYRSGIDGASEMIGKADISLAQGNDSLALTQYQAVAAEYSNSVANRANLNAAILLYQEGKYQEALNSLNEYSLDDELIGAAAESLKGDCLVNLKKYDEAIASYDNAISVSADNALYTPLFMMKKATVLSAQKKYADAAAIYQKIKESYPKYLMAYRVNIDKYIDRAAFFVSVSQLLVYATYHFKTAARYSKMAGTVETVGANLAFGKPYGLDKIVDRVELQRSQAESFANHLHHTAIFL